MSLDPIAYDQLFSSVLDLTSYCEKQSSKNWSVLAMAKSVFSDLINILKCL